MKVNGIPTRTIRALDDGTAVEIIDQTLLPYRFEKRVLSDWRDCVEAIDVMRVRGAPLIGINDSGGARIQEGVNSLSGYTEIFQRNILASGVIPQISAIFGPCAGGAVYSPALTDFILMNQGTSYMFVTGPKVVKTVTGEEVSQEQLGGASVHAAKSGVAHFVSENEEEGIATLRKLLGFLPSNNMEDAPAVDCTDAIDRLDDVLNDIIPDNPNKPYNVLDVIRGVVDNGDFLESQPKFAPNIVTGFARFNGQSVGIIDPAEVPGRRARH